MHEEVKHARGLVGCLLRYTRAKAMQAVQLVFPERADASGETSQ